MMAEPLFLGQWHKKWERKFRQGKDGAEENEKDQSITEQNSGRFIRGMGNFKV